jgi:raffinose/stachyose/melibiose transport system permease protein
MTVAELARPAEARPAARKRWLSGEDLATWVVLGIALLISIGPMAVPRQPVPDGQPADLRRQARRLADPPGELPGRLGATKIGSLYWNSLYISTVSMVLTVIISAFAGYGLGRLEFWGKNYVYLLILDRPDDPLQIALIPLFVNMRWLGIMNTPLALIGPYTAFGLAFGTYVMKAFFQELPKELEGRRPASTAPASSGSSGRSCCR